MGLIRSPKTVYYKLGGRVIVLISSIKYTIGRHLGSRYVTQCVKIVNYVK